MTSNTDIGCSGLKRTRPLLCRVTPEFDFDHLLVVVRQLELTASPLLCLLLCLLLPEPTRNAPKC